MLKLRIDAIAFFVYDVVGMVLSILMLYTMAVDILHPFKKRAMSHVPITVRYLISIISCQNGVYFFMIFYDCLSFKGTKRKKTLKRKI